MIHRFEVVDSTQDLAHQLAADGAAAGTTVIAREQRGGRGTRGRPWIAPVGGLWFSTVVRPAEVAIECLSLRVGLAVAEAVESASNGERVQLKWPNDLILRDRKLGGILVEARWVGERFTWAVVGVGINVVNPIPTALASEAICLADAVPAAMPATIEATVVEAVRMAAALAAGTLDRGELARFAARDWLRGRTLPNPPGARFDGITGKGELIVALPDGQRTSLAGPRSLADLAGALGPI
ncbi:MAG: biotin--[acetyl-CoA-carboxylase] ligase [Gemmatimonadales bacterium]